MATGGGMYDAFYGEEGSALRELYRLESEENKPSFVPFPEMVDPNKPLLPQTTDRTAGVSFTNPVFEFDDNTQYNTGDNLSTDPSFLTPIRPRPGTVEPFSTPGRPVAGVSTLAQRLHYTDMEDKLRLSLKKTGWTFTNTGVTKLSTRISAQGAKYILCTRIMGN